MTLIGPRPRSMRELPDPTGERFGIPTYAWRCAPSHFKTRRQLAKDGLQPNRQGIQAQTIRLRSRGREPLVAYLYDERLAAPKQPAHPGRLAGLARGRLEIQLRAAERHGISRAEMLAARIEHPESVPGTAQVLPQVLSQVLPQAATALATVQPCRAESSARDAGETVVFPIASAASAADTDFQPAADSEQLRGGNGGARCA